jgi:hypothetical protein
MARIGSAGMDLAELTREIAVAHRGSAFAVPAAGLTLTLDQVRVWPAPADAPRPPFALELLGPHAPVLPQGIHRLEHAELGTLEIFLVPVQPDAAGARYDAVFA